MTPSVAAPGVTHPSDATAEIVVGKANFQPVPVLEYELSTRFSNEESILTLTVETKHQNTPRVIKSLRTMLTIYLSYEESAETGKKTVPRCQY